MSVHLDHMIVITMLSAVVLIDHINALVTKDTRVMVSLVQVSGRVHIFLPLNGI